MEKQYLENQLLVGVLTIEDQVVVFWVLAMQDVGLSISLQQLKMKVVELTQTRPTPFQAILRTSQWY